MSRHEHEHSDVNVAMIAKFVIGLLLLVVAAQLLMGWMFQYLAGREGPEAPPSPIASTDALPPKPRLQVRPAADLDSQRRAEDSVLATYGWVDRKQGIVRIPITRAMELIAERGLPARPAAEGGGR